LGYFIGLLYLATATPARTHRPQVVTKTIISFKNIFPTLKNLELTRLSLFYAFIIPLLQSAS